MDDFDFKSPTTSRRRSRDRIFNLLTAVLLLITLCVAGYYAVLLVNPGSSLNPFPPPTLPALMSFPTATPTPRQLLPPTWTPGPTLAPTETSTPLPSIPPSPTNTALPSPTAFPLFSVTPSPEPGDSEFSFEMIGAEPKAIASTTFPANQEAGCDWLGVAGRAYDMSNAPIATGLVIQLGGYLGSRVFSEYALTGSARGIYGDSAYEFRLGDQPVNSNQTLYVQLLDQAGLPMSDKIYFSTYAECERNLILIDFKQVR